MITQTILTVRYAETDRMGIVHHSNYPIWFEAARTDFLKQAGMSYDSMERNGVMLPLYELACRFNSPARYGEDVVVKTKLRCFKGARAEFEYEVLNREGMLLASGKTCHAVTGTDLKPINLKKTRPDLYEFLAGLAEDR